MDTTTENLLPNRRTAAEAGAKRYLGGPCHRCQNRIRYTSNSSCVACQQKRLYLYNRGLRDLLKQNEAPRG
jgi:hypothetical protein